MQKIIKIFSYYFILSKKEIIRLYKRALYFESNSIGFKKKNKNLLYSYFQLINFALCSDDFTQKFLTFFTKNNKMLKQD